MSQLADVIVPANEEGTRATILRWYKNIGDAVAKDEPLVELETDKVTVEIPAPVAGTLVEVLKAIDAQVSPDDVLARLSLGTPSAVADSKAPVEASAAKGAVASAAHASARKALSPAVRRMLRQHELTAAQIDGSGRNGRITTQDVTRHLAGAPTADTTRTPSSVLATPTLELPAPHSAAGTTRVPHTSIRRRIAEHMVRSLTDAPHVTTLFEADLTRVLAHRARHGAHFESQGARLTLTAYFLSACVRALREFPEVNATFHEDALELHADVNIGVGTALGKKGLIVPVIHRAQGMNLLGLALRLKHLVEAARIGKLAPEDVRGGTFTISNHGVSGSLLAAPIVINQPQVAKIGRAHV